MIPDIGGMRPLFEELIADLAATYGWAVAAFEPFPGQDLPTIEDRFAAVPGLSDERLIGDAVAAADLLKERAGVDRVAVIGFCMGGMYTYKVAATGRFDRAVPFYGMIRLPSAWIGPEQREPLECLASSSTCPILSVIGGKDPYTPPDDVAALEPFAHRLTKAFYPEAEHGFVHDASRPSHRAEDAADAWKRVASFLATDPSGG